MGGRQVGGGERGEAGISLTVTIDSVTQTVSLVTSHADASEARHLTSSPGTTSFGVGAARRTGRDGVGHPADVGVEEGGTGENEGAERAPRAESG